MGIITTRMDDLQKYVDNVYEAVVVIAKRAKQINDEQKIIMETQIGPMEEIEDYDDEEEMENEIERAEPPVYMKLPKPTKIALEELLSGKIKFEYLKSDDAVK